jgi:hypothetical protein
MKGGRHNPRKVSAKLALIAPHAEDLPAIFKALAVSRPESVLREYPLAALRALRWQFIHRPQAPAKESLVSVHGLVGNDHHLALREVLLSNVDGILFLLPMDPRQHQACLQCLQETSQIIREQGADLREMPLAILYTQCHLAAADTIREWDRLLECEKYQIPRFCLCNPTDEGAPLAIQALLDRVLSLPTIRLLPLN